ncbi:MAG: aminomethyltransferase family protein [Hydrogenophaga sp.]|jgi:aminomethyltransferase|uniref:aminomethyltransferase family protein n=1 Tax=Hydrogenophaga sp. TaxID=1904254 RepID=UPI0025B90312|nr:aminomethyltransferase family protein [Hydrogenophaga sp.]MBU4183658.1 aminomethyltransferase family protein [Gammaproteobacteria bacterium]MBU4281168.1 aminomethyltransferase family protein [Gammaproteobacteria bacterium]MBU4321706.1 aminomethyltransferase family protein [Gammaproteobacteria bacterium]MCG2655554.1 aminomethyltransferase family protein [Hydrogenophaga sp.]MDZ4291760.1 aminomethyltransferase family protein [Hydrogenophaga sp.]
MNSWRISALADRHRALGSSLGDWNGMGTAWTYSSDLADEHEAIRTKAGLMDVSGLKKMHLVGPHAEMLINQATTRNVSKLYPGKSVYACMLNEAGKFIDDCVIYRISPNAFMVVHGAGQGHEILTRGAVGRNVAVLFDDDLHDLSLQGPLAVSFLEKFVPGVRQLPYFHHMHTTLFGAPIMLSRTGYTGERGYEIFCKAANAPKIWDTVLAEGKAMGIIPCAFTTLDWLRVESSLMFYPYDNSDMYPMEGEPIGDSLWELGLDFTVSPGKTEFRGATEHFRLQGQERFKIFGVEMQQFEAAQAGDGLWDGDKKVGFVTCAMISRLTKKSMAIARLDPAYAVPGRALELRGAAMTSAATTASLPFDDPQKLKRTAKD